jgi:hypothetical protein
MGARAREAAERDHTWTAVVDRVLALAAPGRPVTTAEVA